MSFPQDLPQFELAADGVDSHLFLRLTFGGSYPAFPAGNARRLSPHSEGTTIAWHHLWFSRMREFIEEHRLTGQEVALCTRG